MKISFSLLVFFYLFISSLTAQEGYEEGTVYLRNGERVPALVKVKSENPLEISYKSLDGNSFKIKKVSRIETDTFNFEYLHFQLKRRLLKQLVDGEPSIYTDGEDYFYQIKSLNNYAYLLKKRKLDKLYSYFIEDTLYRDRITKDYFITKAQLKEDGLTEKKSKYDKTKGYKNILLGSASLFHPDLGLELRIVDRISWHNSAGYNIGYNLAGRASPDLHTGLRCFFGLQRRKIKRNRFYNYSSYYVELSQDKYFPNFNQQIKTAYDVTMLGIGFQKNNPINYKHSSFRYAMGYDQFSNLWFSFEVNLGFSAILIKKKKILQSVVND